MNAVVALVWAFGAIPRIVARHASLHVSLGEQSATGSLQEVLAAKVVPLFDADGYNFLSAGREDVDVRMLGDGRPFILEVKKLQFGVIGTFY